MLQEDKKEIAEEFKEKLKSVLKEKSDLFNTDAPPEDKVWVFSWSILENDRGELCSFVIIFGAQSPLFELGKSDNYTANVLCNCYLSFHISC